MNSTGASLHLLSATPLAKPFCFARPNVPFGTGGLFLFYLMPNLFHISLAGNLKDLAVFFDIPGL